MNNVVLSTRNIDDLILDIANEVVKKLSGVTSQDSKSIETEPDSLSILTVPQAAKFLSLTVPTVYSLISRGELPAMKRNGRVYFSKADLFEYLKAGRKKTNYEIQAEASEYLSKKNRSR